MGLARQVSTNSNIKYYDCSTPGDRHEIDIRSACTPTVTTTTNKQTYTILQPRHHQTFHGYTCQVTRSSFTLYCGAFSHLKFINIPQIEINEEISGADCYSAAKRGLYRDHTGRNRDVELGMNVWTINDLGTLMEDNGAISCQGEDARIGDDIVHQVVRLSQYKLEVRREKFIVQGDTIEAVLTQTKLPDNCQPDEKICVTDEMTFIFNSKKQCNLVKVQMIQLEKENDLLVDHSNKLIFKKGTSQPFSPDCGVGSYYTTEYSKLYLTNQTDNEFEPVTELDLDLYINSRSDYVVYKAEKLLQSLTAQLEGEVCNARMTETTREDDKIFKLKTGEFAMTRGDVLTLFSCPARVETIKETDVCYTKIPLVTGKFVDPTTRLLSNTAAEVDCNAKFPLVVKAVEGWISVGPGVTVRHSPASGSVLPGADHLHEDMAGGGLYSAEELENWEDHISWGDYKDSTNLQLIAGICAAGDVCPSPHPRKQPTYDLGQLVQRMEKVDKLNDIKNFVKTWGGAAAFVVLIKWSAEMIVGSIVLFLTYSSMGFSTARTLFTTMMCGSFTQHRKLRKKFWKYETERIGMSRNYLENENEEYSCVRYSKEPRPDQALPAVPDSICQTLGAEK